MHATKLLVAALATAGAVQAAEITIYKQPNFTGGEQTFNRDTASLQGTGVYDQEHGRLLEMALAGAGRQGIGDGIARDPDQPGRQPCRLWAIAGP